jgi:thiamine biosynthesis lipoprotein
MKYSYYFILLLVLLACKPQKGYKVYSGEAQGTTFLIKYESTTGYEFDEEIDSIFQSLDQSFSTYLSGSVISDFNQSENGVLVDRVFADLWEKCWELNIETDGYFDPTLSTVFEAYESMSKDILDSNLVYEALQHTGMPLVSLKGDSLIKRDTRVKINLNAVAQGYTVDILSEFLSGKGINNFMVEVGGEVYAIGKNDKGLTWTIGIDKPIEQGRQLITTLKLDAMSMATSGNYRKFKEIDGKKMGHIINPKTGFPGYSNILSVSVLTRYCYRADALATGLMNMSSQEIKEFDQNMNDVQLILIELNEGDTSIYVSRELREKVSL